MHGQGERADGVGSARWELAGTGLFMFAHKTHIYHFMNKVGTYVTITQGNKKNDIINTLKKFSQWSSLIRVLSICPRYNHYSGFTDNL